jgi:hypothetical protein
MPVIIEQKFWGICGFVSVLNGLRAAGLITKWTGPQQWGDMPLEEIQTRLYAEIVAYLNYLIFTESPLVAQIEKISENLKPKGEPSRTLKEVVAFIKGQLRTIARSRNAEGVKLMQIQGLIEKDGVNGVTVAMTPDALVDYMKWAGVVNAANANVEVMANTSENLLTYKNSVIGIGTGGGIFKSYNGLEHWIYVDKNGVLNNWGATENLTGVKNALTLFGKNAGDWATKITHVIRMG